MARLGTVYVDVKGNLVPLERQVETAFGPARMSTTGARAGSAFSSGLARHSQGITALGRNFERAGSSLYVTGRELSRGITAPLALAGGAAVKFNIDFEKAMTLIHTQAGASAEEVKSLTGSVLDLAREGEHGPTELANALYHLESVGLRGGRAMEALKVAEEGATVGGADLESVTNALAGATQSGIEGTQNLEEAMGTLNAIVGQGNLRMQDLVGALSTGILPVARSFGLGLNDVGAALDVLTAKGVPAEEAATRLRMTFSLMGAPTSRAEGELKKLGLTGLDVARTMRSRGLIPALELLKGHLDAFTRDPSKQAQLITRMFGGGRSSSAIITLLQNLDDLQRRQDGIVTNSKRMGEAIAASHETAAYKVHHAWANLQVALVEVGGDIAPGLESAASALAAVASAFADLPRPIRNATVDTLGLLAIVGPIGLTLGALARGTGLVLVGLGKVGTGAAWAVGQFESIFVPGMAAAGAAGGESALAGAAASTPQYSVLGTEAGGAFSLSYRVAAQGGVAASTTMVAGEAAALTPVMAEEGAAAGAAFSGGIIAASPALAFVAIAAASAAASYEVVKHWGAVKGFLERESHDIGHDFSGAWDVIQRKSGLSSGFAKRSFSALGTAARVAAEGAKGAWGEFGDYIKNRFSWIGSLVDWLIGKFSDLGDAVPDISISVPNVGGLKSLLPGHAVGGMVGGSGFGDKVPALLEPGEGIINSVAVRKMGGPQAVEKINRQWPRFQQGGVVGTVRRSLRFDHHEEEEREGYRAGGTVRKPRPRRSIAFDDHGKPADPLLPRALAFERQIWDETTPLLGAQGYPMPKAHFRKPEGGRAPGAIGEVYYKNDRDQIDLAPSVERQLAERKYGGLHTYLHEMAHVFQGFVSERFGGAEGGAEAFARWASPTVAKALGVPVDRRADYAYPEQTAEARKHPEVYKHKQFGLTKKGKPKEKPHKPWYEHYARGGMARLAPEEPSSGASGTTRPIVSERKAPEIRAAYDSPSRFAHFITGGTARRDERTARASRPAGPQGPASPNYGLDPTPAGPPGPAGPRGVGTFLSTAYGPPWNSMQGFGTTAGGTNLKNAPHVLIVASDPRVLPLGTKITAHPNPFQTAQPFLVDDTGGAIKGRHIDFYDWRGRASQNAWGTKNTSVATVGHASKPIHVGPLPKGGGAGKPQTPKERSYGYSYPLSRRGKIIGTPYKGTHTLGNWQSDNAVDIAVPFGTNVLAVAGGNIVKTGGSGNFSGRFGGYNLTLASPHNAFFYTHLSKIRENIKAGTQVQKAEVIGASGKANGVNHLHFGQQHGSPLGTVRSPLSQEPSAQTIHVPGAGNITIQGNADVGTVRDAVTARYESRLARAKLTPRLADDLHWERALLALWRGRLRFGEKTHDDNLIIQAANSVAQYKTEIADTRKKIRERHGKPELFQLGGLSQIDGVNLGGLAPQMAKLDLNVATAALSGPGEPGGGLSGFDDDVQAAQEVVTIWTSIWNLAKGGDLGPGFGKKDKKTGKWYFPGGTVKQKTEAATNLGSAKSALATAKEEQKGSADATQQDIDTNRADILEQLLQTSRRELAVARAEFSVLSSFERLPRFHEGGVIPGPVGAEVPVMAKGGEVIGYAGEQKQQEPGFAVIVKDGAVNQDAIEVVALNALSERDRQLVRKARSGAVGRKHGLLR